MSLDVSLKQKGELNSQEEDIENFLASTSNYEESRKHFLNNESILLNLKTINDLLNSTELSRIPKACKEQVNALRVGIRDTLQPVVQEIILMQQKNLEAKNGRTIAEGDHVTIIYGHLKLLNELLSKTRSPPACKQYIDNLRIQIKDAVQPLVEKILSLQHFITLQVKWASQTDFPS